MVRESNFLGVVASNEWDAIRGAQPLKASWSKSETLPDQAKLWDHVRAHQGRSRTRSPARVGNATEALGKDGVKKLVGDL